MSRQPTSYFHRGGDQALLGATIAEHFSDVVARFGEHEAVVSLPQQRRLSYRALADAVDRLAKGLAGSGFVKGDRIGIWSTNNIEWLLLQMATARIGAVLVNINPAYRLRELAYALRALRGTGAIHDTRLSQQRLCRDAGGTDPGINTDRDQDALNNSAFPLLRKVIVYDPADAEQTQRPHDGFTTWQDVIQAGSSMTTAALDAITASLDRDDAINIQYTSGTTGFPKAVVLTHHNILNNAWFSAQSMHFSEHDRLCVPVPFYHCFGMVLANLLCLSVGACIVIPASTSMPSRCCKTIEAERCTAIHGVPTMFIAELEHEDFNKYDLSSLRTGIMAGAPCPPALMQRVMQDMHCSEILIGYGETEASPLTHLTTRDDSLERRTETVGKNLPHQEVKIVNTETGATVPLGEIGEICFRGYHIMRGYYGEPDKTAEAIDANGWLYSGDLGTMDSDGYVRITGRRKEMIIRGGENIYPNEIENFLFTHPKVAQVAVFGVPDNLIRRNHHGLDPVAPRRTLRRRRDTRLLQRPDRAFQDPQIHRLRRRVPDDRDR